MRTPEYNTMFYNTAGEKAGLQGPRPNRVFPVKANVKQSTDAKTNEAVEYCGGPACSCTTQIIIPHGRSS